MKYSLKEVFIQLISKFDIKLNQFKNKIYFANSQKAFIIWNIRMTRAVKIMIKI
jgi:predicted lipoprotein